MEEDHLALKHIYLEYEKKYIKIKRNETFINFNIHFACHIGLFTM